MSERAVLAGGCLGWCLIRKMPEETRVGYTGGDVPRATYPNMAPMLKGFSDL